MKKKIALITGITGQDGSILAKLLLQKNYLVHGIKRRSSSFNTQRLDDIYKDLHEPNPDFFLHYGDLTDFPSILNIIQKVQPNEIYNLAAQSHVQVSFETPEYTANADAIGTLRILEAIRVLKLEKRLNFIKPRHLKCMDHLHHLNVKILLCILPALMELQNFMLIGLLRIIENLTICSHLLEFYLIMKVHLEGKHLLVER